MCRRDCRPERRRSLRRWYWDRTVLAADAGAQLQLPALIVVAPVYAWEPVKVTRPPPETLTEDEPLIPLNRNWSPCN